MYNSLRNKTELIQVIRENTSDYDGPHSKIISHTADIYEVIYELLKRQALPMEYRRYPITALGYFSLTDDIMSTYDHGIAGYYDDAYLGAYILKLLLDDFEYEVIDHHWKGSINLKELLGTPFTELEKELGSKCQMILRLVGLR